MEEARGGGKKGQSNFSCRGKRGGTNGIIFPKGEGTLLGKGASNRGKTKEGGNEGRAIRTRDSQRNNTTRPATSLLHRERAGGEERDYVLFRTITNTRESRGGGSPCCGDWGVGGWGGKFCGW